MIDKIKKVLQDVSEVIKDQTNAIGDGAKEKSFRLIEEWLQIFPKLESYGFEMTSFALGAAISPSVEVEMKAPHGQFPIAKIQDIIEQNKKTSAINTVFTTIRTAYQLHEKTASPLQEPLILKIRIRISPEIQVFLGEPIIQ